MILFFFFFKNEQGSNAKIESRAAMCSEKSRNPFFRERDTHTHTNEADGQKEAKTRDHKIPESWRK